MSKLTLLVILFVCFVIERGSTNNGEVHSRHKRCIVVQKQSGTHGDSNEGADVDGEEDDDDDEAYRHPKPEKPEPKPITTGYKRNYDIETLPLPPLKYTKANPTRKTNKKYRDQKISNKLHKYTNFAQS